MMCRLDMRGQEQVARLADYLLRGVAEDSFGALIEQYNLLSLVHRNDRVVGDVEDASQPRLRSLECCLGSLAFGDVASDTFERCQVAQLIVDQC